LKKIFKAAWPYIRVVLSVLLLWLAVRNIDWKALKESDISIQPAWLMLAIAIMVLNNLMATARWGWLMRSVGLMRSNFEYVTLYFTGGLINQGLPSTIGGDSYRAIEGSRAASNSKEPLPSLSEELHQTLDLNKAPRRLRLGFVATALDRILGLIGNNILGAVGLILGGAMIAPWGQILGWLALVGMLGSVVLAYVFLRLSVTRKLIQNLLNKLGMPGAIAALDRAFGWPDVLPQLLNSTLIHLLTTVAFWCCLRAYGVSAPLEALMVGLPALGLLTMLPISISGWGLREATLSAALALWGVDPSVSVMASVSFGLITVIVYLPSAFALLKRRQQSV